MSSFNLESTIERICLLTVTTPIHDHGNHQRGRFRSPRSSGRTGEIHTSQEQIDLRQLRQSLLPCEIDEILLLPEGRNWAIVYSPMASGLLTGAMPCERAASLPKITGAGGMPTLRNQMSHNMALVERMREIANRHKRSVGEVAIAWTLRHSVVPAPSSVPAICARQRESCALASCTSTRSKPLSKPRLDRVRNTGRAGAKGWLTLRDYDLRALLAAPFARQLIPVMASKKAPNSFRALL